MKYFYLLPLFLMPLLSFGQKEKQSFCDGDPEGEYFPLNIGKKTIRWYNTAYKETLLSDKIINGKKYLAYEQAWGNGMKDTLYLRLDGHAIVEFSEKKGDIMRYDDRKIPGDTWTGQNFKYTLLSYDETLDTPVCHYKNLMAIEADDEADSFVFYYLRGYGYIGAVKNNKLISYVIPKI